MDEDILGMKIWKEYKSSISLKLSKGLDPLAPDVTVWLILNIQYRLYDKYSSLLEYILENSLVFHPSLITEHATSNCFEYIQTSHKNIWPTT
jgi:hypothetical protein